MPSMQGVSVGEIVIGFDTSGSCFGTDTMTHFVSEITSLIEMVCPEKVHVIYWDTHIAGHQTFEEGQFAVQQMKVRGGGGTDGEEGRGAGDGGRGISRFGDLVISDLPYRASQIARSPNHQITKCID